MLSHLKTTFDISRNQQVRSTVSQIATKKNTWVATRDVPHQGRNTNHASLKHWHFRWNAKKPEICGKGTPQGPKRWHLFLQTPETQAKRSCNLSAVSHIIFFKLNRMEHCKTPAIAHSCPTLHLGHLVHRNVLMTSLYQTLATPIAAQERTTSSWKRAKQFSGEIGLTGLLRMCWPFFSPQKSMSFLTESEAASMGFRKEGSLIATLTVQSPFEMLHKVTSFSCPGYSLNAFLGGCTPNCPSHGCTPLQFKSTSHGCQKSKCLFLNLITFSKHFQTIIFSMQVEFRAWNPPPIWGLGEWLLAQAVYFALEICIYDDIFNLISLIVSKLGHLSLPRVKRWNYKKYWKPAPRKIGCISWLRRVPKST